MPDGPALAKPFLGSAGAGTRATLERSKARLGDKGAGMLPAGPAVGVRAPKVQSASLGGMAPLALGFHNFHDRVQATLGSIRQAASRTTLSPGDRPSVRDFVRFGLELLLVVQSLSDPLLPHSKNGHGLPYDFCKVTC